jgi:drug/metabolite transporter (DMT)-like permease
MTAVAHDAAGSSSPAPGARPPSLSGLLFALASATSFGMAGPLAKGLIDAGWSAGAVVLVRLGVAAAVVAPIGVVALRGRWGLLRRNAGTILLYGGLAVAGAQFCYFAAVSHMQVGPALMIEFTAPAAVVVWLWLRHGQRPSPVTLAGAGLAALGLALVLDLWSGAELNLTGVLWALGAMLGAAAYFLISADRGNGLPPAVLAAGGLVVATAGVGLLSAVGVLGMQATRAPVTYAGHTVAWWLPLVVLGLATSALSYLTGIAAGRRLGSRVASFVGLLEVVAAVGFAWLLLGELPRAVQLLGGLVIMAGVLAVRLGERDVRADTRSSLVRPQEASGGR